MKIPWPEKREEYPFFIFLYWLVIWGFLFLYSSFVIVSGLTSDGKYVEKTDCLEKDGSGCIKYSNPYYIPVGSEMKFSLIQQGIMTGIGTIIVGGALMNKKRKTVNRRQKTDSGRQKKRNMIR